MQDSCPLSSLPKSEVASDRFSNGYTGYVSTGHTKYFHMCRPNVARYTKVYTSLPRKKIAWHTLRHLYIFLSLVYQIRKNGRNLRTFYSHVAGVPHCKVPLLFPETNRHVLLPDFQKVHHQPLVLSR